MTAPNSGSSSAGADDPKPHLHIQPTSDKSDRQVHPHIHDPASLRRIVARIILDEHLSECITRAAEAGNIEDEVEELKTALDRFLP